MELTIERLDSRSTGALFDSAFELHRTMVAERDPIVDPDTESLFRAGLEGTETFTTQTVVASDGDLALGRAIIEMHHLKSNSDKAETEIVVHPDHRRQGIGTALLNAVLDVAKSGGRSSIAAFAVNCDETKGFWEAMGAEQKSLERESRLWLADTDESTMHEWIDKAAMRAGDYRLEHYRGVTPPHLRSAAVHLTTTMNDAPRDDLDWEDDVWTEDDIVQLDEMIIGRGRERWTTFAFSPDDQPAGQTSISIQPEKPRFAWQGNTVVDPAHRNRGIGRWLKADMWLRMRREVPFVEAIDTDNADSNDPMLAINDAMGFAPLHEWYVYQADASDMRAHCRGE